MRRRWYAPAAVAAIFLVIILIIVVLGRERALALSDVRAYVAGEGLYSKAQKRAVIELYRYARTRSDADYERFLAALEVPFGDRDARLLLLRNPPDLQGATAAFIRGRNHPDDVDRMARFFVRFKDIHYIAEAIRIWTEADGEIARLARLGERMRERIRSADADGGEIEHLLSQVEMTDRRLTELEDLFSLTLGDGARFMVDATGFLMIAASVLLLLIGYAFSRYVGRAVRAADEALLRSEHRYRTLSETMADGLLILRDGRFLYANAAAQRMLGRPLEALRDTPFGPLIHPDFRDLVAERHRRRSAGDSLPPRYDIRIVTPDDPGLWVQISNERIDWEGAPAVLTIMSDITERKRAEERLRESEAVKSGILESSMDAIITMDHAGRVREFNRSAEQLFGWPRAEAVGQSLSALIVPPELRASHAAGLARYLESGEERVIGRRIEVTALRRSGERFDAELTVVRIEGSEPPVFAGTIRDITRRKDAEAKILRLNETLEARVEERTAELRAALSEMESFSYSISHDLRTPLRAMHAYAEILVREHAARLDGDAHRMLSRISENATHMAGLIDGLLDFARLGRAEFAGERVDMERLARDVADELRALNPSWSDIALEIGFLPEARGDAQMLRQVWMNLLGNAFKFCAGRDAPAVSVRADEDAAQLHYTVRDNGVGFDAAHAGRLFGVFQRLHPVGAYPGTGIGLAHVKRIVERHGGSVHAQSPPGGGATFGFSLPKPGA